MKIGQKVNLTRTSSASSSRAAKPKKSNSRADTGDRFSASSDNQPLDSRLKNIATRAGGRLRETATDALLWTSMAAMTVTLGAIPGVGAMVGFLNSDTGGNGDFLRVLGSLSNVAGTVSLIGQGNAVTTLGALGLAGGLIASSFLLD